MALKWIGIHRMTSQRGPERVSSWAPVGMEKRERLTELPNHGIQKLLSDSPKEKGFTPRRMLNSGLSEQSGELEIFTSNRK